MQTFQRIFDYLTDRTLTIILIVVSLVGSYFYGIYSEQIVTRRQVGLAVAQTLGMPPDSLISENPMCLSTGCITYLYFATSMDEAQLLEQMRKSPYGFYEYDKFEDYNVYTVPDIANHQVVFVPGRTPMPSPRRIHGYGQFPVSNVKPNHHIQPVIFPIAQVPKSYTYQGKSFRLNLVQLYVSEPNH